MRLGFGLAALALGLLAGCAGNAVVDVADKLGCGEVDGLKQITSEKPPAFILVGEFVETNEAPAAFAELACQLAARQVKDRPLWVGLSEYVGGSSSAERAMRARLEDLVSRGAPMVIGSVLDGHPTSARDRLVAEKFWAETIMANVKSVGAGRALLLMPRVDAVAEPVKTTSERFDGYDPMTLHLPPGQVLNLEIGQAAGLDVPTIRIYPAMTDGFMGQIALSALTPATVTADAGRPSAPWRRNPAGLSQDMIRYVAESGLPRDQQVDVLAMYLEIEMRADRRARIEARRQMSMIRISDARIAELVPNPFAESPVTQYPAIARSKASEELGAWEQRKAQGIPPPFGHSQTPPDLVDLVEKQLGYVPN
jgi:hypothetical protein